MKNPIKLTDGDHLLPCGATLTVHGGLPKHLTMPGAVQGRHVPCGECGEPVSDAALVAAQDARIASFPGPAPAVTTEARAHHDCDDPGAGTRGAAEGYAPSGVA